MAAIAAAGGDSGAAAEAVDPDAAVEAVGAPDAAGQAGRLPAPIADAHAAADGAVPQHPWIKAGPQHTFMQSLLHTASITRAAVG